jgi:glycoprotein endo-alpha-1,2-mannosidase
MEDRRSFLRRIALTGMGFLGLDGCKAALEATKGEEKEGVKTMGQGKKVLAFYYPWYGNPRVSGRWLHWQGVDEVKKEIASSTHYPLLGPYDSHDPEVISQHCIWAKRAGIGCFISSWWGRGDFHDEAVPLLLEGAEKEGLEITVYYETVKPQNPSSAASDITYILRSYGDHKAFLKADGKPVIFVYGRTIGEIKLSGWKEAIGKIKEEYGPDFLLIGDQISRDAAAIFDGIHTYNPAGALARKSLEEARAWAKENYRNAVSIAEEQGKISTVTVIPGYDDTKIRKPGLKVERFGGELYKALWDEGIAAKPDWILITSWNEWHEGSEIEPSLEDGELYIELTREYTKKFLAS